MIHPTSKGMHTILQFHFIVLTFILTNTRVKLFSKRTRVSQ